MRLFYVIIEAGPGEEFKGEIVEVPYDFGKTAGEILDSGLPREFAGAVLTGLY